MSEFGPEPPTGASPGARLPQVEAEVDQKVEQLTGAGGTQFLGTGQQQLQQQERGPDSLLDAPLDEQAQMAVGNVASLAWADARAAGREEGFGFAQMDLGKPGGEEGGRQALRGAQGGGGMAAEMGDGTAGDVPVAMPADRRLQRAIYSYAGHAQRTGPQLQQQDASVVLKSFVLLDVDGRPKMDDGVDRSLVAVMDGHGPRGAMAANYVAQNLPTLLAQEPGLAGSDGDPFKPLPNQEDERRGVWKAFNGAALQLEQGLAQTLVGQAQGQQQQQQQQWLGGDTGVLGPAEGAAAAGGGGVAGGAGVAAATLAPSGGTTFAAALRIGRVLYVAHCGDSSVLCCRRGHLLRLTQSHTGMVGEELRRVMRHGGEVDDQGRVHIGQVSLDVTRALGDVELKTPEQVVDWHPDVGALVLQEDDQFVVLVTAGISDVMSDHQVIEFVQRRIEATPEWQEGAMSDAVAARIADELAEQALQRGSRSNTCAALLLLQWGPPHHM